ncbi:MAM and fibronectin type III domain-containing protein 1-like [Porites lutea]|uniref:MAM and fibronectin type III domain-containing protein 1-like n=1 Tax=Porites lutea TaxID=51062 RepID=UPI003CC67BDB
MVILKDLKEARAYQIAVAAFTSKGEGPRSNWMSIMTGCGRVLTELFGNLQVRSSSYYSSITLRCNWQIQNAGISQAVALVSLPELYLSYYSEYFEIIDGNGVTVLSRNSSVTQKPFKEVSFGNSGIITVQTNLRQSYSNFAFKFGILKQGLQFGELVSQLDSLFASLRKHPFLLALRRWGRFARRNVCDSATEIPY